MNINLFFVATNLISMDQCLLEVNNSFRTGRLFMMEEIPDKTNRLFKAWNQGDLNRKETSLTSQMREDVI